MGADDENSSRNPIPHPEACCCSQWVVLGRIKPRESCWTGPAKPGQSAGPADLAMNPAATVIEMGKMVGGQVSRAIRVSHGRGAH